MQFGAIIFCRTFKNYFGQFVWIETKSHYDSRVSLHEAPTKNLKGFSARRWPIVRPKHVSGWLYSGLRGDPSKRPLPPRASSRHSLSKTETRLPSKSTHCLREF